VASCIGDVAVGRYRELQTRALGKSTYDYIIDYLSKKRLYPPGAFINTVDDWFRYSWLLIANNEPVVYWVGKRVRELIDLGVPPDEITLRAKWVFDVKARKGSRWVGVAHKDPVVSAGLPYWVGFQQVSNKSGVVWGCPANPPGPWSTGGLCSYVCVDDNMFGIYFAGGGKPPSDLQAGVGANCCYSPVGYNMNNPGISFGNTVDTTGTKNVTTWTITGQVTVDVSGPYMVLILGTNVGSGYGTTKNYCYNQCRCSNPGPSAGCGCPTTSSSYFPYPQVDVEVIYENVGSLNLASGTSVTASVQLIISLASPG